MIVMHPLPRVNEIHPEVDLDPRATYFRYVLILYVYFLYGTVRLCVNGFKIGKWKMACMYEWHYLV